MPHPPDIGMRVENAERVLGQQRDPQRAESAWFRGVHSDEILPSDADASIWRIFRCVTPRRTFPP
jgi:hypothetical protein